MKKMERKRRRTSNDPSPCPVRETRVELARHCWHYLLRVARLPISPPALRMECKVTKTFHIPNQWSEIKTKYFDGHAFRDYPPSEFDVDIITMFPGANGYVELRAGIIYPHDYVLKVSRRPVIAALVDVVSEGEGLQ